MRIIKRFRKRKLAAPMSNREKAFAFSPPMKYILEDPA